MGPQTLDAGVYPCNLVVLYLATGDLQRTTIQVELMSVGCVWGRTQVKIREETDADYCFLYKAGPNGLGLKREETDRWQAASHRQPGRFSNHSRRFS